ALVLDYARDATARIDVACAAVGVPYAGPSALWPAIPDETPLLQARRLLTDQGYSEERRREALRRAEQRYGPDAIEWLGAQVLERHELVGFFGGIVLDDEGKAARHLKALFALNAAKQLVTNGDVLAAERR